MLRRASSTPSCAACPGAAFTPEPPQYPRDAQTDPATRVYLFAHETLRVTAEEQLGGELARYREKVHEWIASYAGSGWPGTTPGYAIRGYPRLLTATADVTRLSALARDPRRHAFLLGAREATTRPSPRSRPLRA